MANSLRECSQSAVAGRAVRNPIAGYALGMQSDIIPLCQTHRKCLACAFPDTNDSVDIWKFDHWMTEIVTALDALTEAVRDGSR